MEIPKGVLSLFGGREIWQTRPIWDMREWRGKVWQKESLMMGEDTAVSLLIPLHTQTGPADQWIRRCLLGGCRHWSASMTPGKGEGDIEMGKPNIQESKKNVVKTLHCRQCNLWREVRKCVYLFCYIQSWSMERAVPMAVFVEVSNATKEFYSFLHFLQLHHQQHMSFHLGNAFPYGTYGQRGH